MIQAYDYYNHHHEKAPDEVDEYCRLEGVSLLSIRKAVRKEKSYFGRIHNALRLICAQVLIGSGQQITSLRERRL